MTSEMVVHLTAMHDTADTASLAQDLNEPRPAEFQESCIANDTAMSPVNKAARLLVLIYGLRLR